MKSFSARELNMLRSNRDDFEQERNSEIINKEIKGFFCSNEYPDCIQVSENYEIQEADWLIHVPSKRRYYIDNVKPITETSCILHYQTEYQYSHPKQPNAQYNIGTIHGSAIVGNQQNATINIGASLDEIQKMISADNSINDLDKEQLGKLIERLKIITEDNQPVSKGTLAKFSDLLAKHSNIAVALGQVLINWMRGV